MTGIEAILFDLDGTLIRSEEIWDDIAREFLGRHNVTCDLQEIKDATMGRTLEEGVTYYQEKCGLQGDIKALTQERRAIAKEHLSKNVVFYDGAPEFVQAAKSAYKIAIATSMEQLFLKPIIASLGLQQLFGDNIFSIDEAGVRSKPEPDIFLFSARQLGTEPSHCLVVEDSPNGVEAAKRAGMICAAVTFTTSRPKLAKADIIVDSFAEIPLESMHFAIQ